MSQQLCKVRDLTDFSEGLSIGLKPHIIAFPKAVVCRFSTKKGLLKNS